VLIKRQQQQQCGQWTEQKPSWQKGLNVDFDTKGLFNFEYVTKQGLAIDCGFTTKKVSPKLGMSRVSQRLLSFTTLVWGTSTSSRLWIKTLSA
jgi:hypothetical protein